VPKHEPLVEVSIINDWLYQTQINTSPVLIVYFYIFLPLLEIDFADILYIITFL